MSRLHPFPPGLERRPGEPVGLLPKGARWALRSGFCSAAVEAACAWVRNRLRGSVQGLCFFNPSSDAVCALREGRPRRSLHSLGAQRHFWAAARSTQKRQVTERS